MGKVRGSANLANFNKERSEEILPLIHHELRKCRKRRLVFSSIGMLAAHISDNIKIHRTTLLRSTKYKVLLFQYLSGSPGTVEYTPDSTTDTYVLQAKLATAKLEVSNLRAELKKVEFMVSNNTSITLERTSETVTVDYANLSMSLVNLLTRHSDLFFLDFKNRQLIDLASRPSERVLAESGQIGRFMAWIEQNQSLPALSNLKRINSNHG